MSEPLQLRLVLSDIDLSNIDEETVSKVFIEEMRKVDYLPTDNYVSLRDKKMSNIRAKRISSQEDVEIYAFSQTIREGSKVYTVVLMKIV